MMGIAMTQKIFAIGDIHGCIDKLENLMSKIPVNWDKDKIVFLGDYIDRGKDPSAVVQFIVELRQRHEDSIICLKGNHEDMFLNFLHNGELADMYLFCGGMETLESYGLDSSIRGIASNRQEVPISPTHMEFLRGLKICHEWNGFFFVHAGVQPGIPLAMQKEYHMLWIRHKFIDSSYDWGKKIVFGHTHFDAPLIQDNKIGIDTGAVFGGKLTCAILPDMDFIFS